MMKLILSCLILASIALGQNIDDCISNPCQHDSLCIPDVNGYGFDCNCTEGFTGSTCSEIYGEPCLSNPCFNGGTCDPSTGMCTCREGWESWDCREPMDTFPEIVCQSNPCLNGGTCIKEDGQYPNYECKCLSIFEDHDCEGWVGTGLDLLVNETGCCLSQPCLYDGTCSESGSGFTCSCNTGYTGSYCQIIDESVCASNPCHHGGTCTPNGNSFSCTCDNRFEGEACETFKDGVCLSDPCIYGTCSDMGGGEYECICTEGFSGLNCEVIGLEPCAGTRFSLNLLILLASLCFVFSLKKV